MAIILRNCYKKILVTGTKVRCLKLSDRINIGTYGHKSESEQPMPFKSKIFLCVLFFFSLKMIELTLES